MENWGANRKLQCLLFSTYIEIVCTPNTDYYNPRTIITNSAHQMSPYKLRISLGTRHFSKFKEEIGTILKFL